MSKVIDVEAGNVEVNVEIWDSRDKEDTEYVFDLPETLYIYPDPNDIGGWFQITHSKGFWGMGRFRNGVLEV